MFKDFDAMARNNFLQDQVMENDEKRGLLLDAIDAAYQQWLDKLAQLKAEIDKFEPEYIHEN